MCIACGSTPHVAYNTPSFSFHSLNIASIYSKRPHPWYIVWFPKLSHLASTSLRSLIKDLASTKLSLPPHSSPQAYTLKTQVQRSYLYCFKEFAYDLSHRSSHHQSRKLHRIFASTAINNKPDRR